MRAYLDQAEAELKDVLKIADAGQRCISFLPYINQKDKRLGILFTPSVHKPGSTSGNGPFKHRFNKKVRPPFGNEGAKAEPVVAPDPENPYVVLPTPTDPYNYGQGLP